MRPLQIALVMLEPPLPFGSAAARVYYSLIQGLLERGHRVKAFATCSRSEEVAQAAELFRESRCDLRCYPHPSRTSIRSKLQGLGQPFSYMLGDDVRGDIERHLESGCDILHLEQLLAGWLALDHVDQTLISVHYLSQIDLSVRSRNLKNRIEYALLCRTESRLLHSFKYFRSLSGRLTEAILRVNPVADVTTAPIGLDLTLYPFIADERRFKEPIVSLIGSMDWYPSRSAAERLLTRLYPEIRRRVPNARFQIVGWSARAVLKDYLDLPNVEIFENVPDVKPYFEHAGVLLYAPERGSGVKVKVLEAMAYGIPVVTTAEGIEGIQAADGVQAALADDDQGLIDRTVELLLDPEEQNRRRRAARELLEAAFKPAAAARRLEQIYDRIIKASAELDRPAEGTYV